MHMYSEQYKMLQLCRHVCRLGYARLGQFINDNQCSNSLGLASQTIQNGSEYAYLISNLV